ncbi:MAG: DUF4124 domain-containing protein [Candidatus Contendobacter sp.]|nr:DUF4124 domain-containing protein [Candidatus Contendobacter sp.]MDG4558767.1 DUF4124 domain-containing protein [Candidatus Contendobacter sp.]
MLKRALWLILAAGCGGAVVTTQAQQFIYKWTDEEGRIKYSELAPPTGVKYETVHKSSVPAGSQVDVSAQQAKEREALAREQAKQKEQTEQTQKEAEEGRTKNCEIAKKNVEVLQGPGRVVRTDAQGKKVTLDAEQRAAELKKAQSEQEYYCSP